MPDREILDLAKKNELSYLGSFLKAIEQGDENEPVTAKYLTRRCCLAVNPAFAPACMDAEEFVLAALEFLESAAVDTTDHPHLPRLPLIQAGRPENDIRKRTYTKAYPWKLVDMLDSISYLENIFLSDASEYKWLRREAFAPMNMDATALEALLLKGKFRASSTKKKAPASRTKQPKQPRPLSSVGGSVNSASKIPIATEASRNVQQAGSRSGDDSF